MKQVFTLLFLCCGLLTATFAQNKLAFQADSVAVQQVDPTEFEYYVYFNIINTSSDSVSVTAERINNLAEGHGTFFCWDLCYDTVRNTALSPIAIAPGDTTQFQQYIVFKPNNIDGYSESTMLFIDVDSAENFLQRTYKYQVGEATSITATTQTSKWMAYPFPQGQRGTVTVPYTLPQGATNGTLMIRDMSGRLVSNISLNETRANLQLNTTDWKAGLYTLSLQVNQQVYATRKLAVSP